MLRKETPKIEEF